MLHILLRGIFFSENSKKEITRRYSSKLEKWWSEPVAVQLRCPRTPSYARCDRPVSLAGRPEAAASKLDPCAMIYFHLIMAEATFGPFSTLVTTRLPGPLRQLGVVDDAILMPRLPTHVIIGSLDLFCRVPPVM